MKNFGCERRWLINLYRHYPDTACLEHRHMKSISYAETFNSEMKQSIGINLDKISTDAIDIYRKTKNTETRRKMLNIIKKALKTNIDPITGREFEEYKITKHLMAGIKVLASGSLTKNELLQRYTDKKSFTSEDLELIDELLVTAIT